jgi:diadenosine tetraphosphate (Ap4A) HIT family hydrolase
MDSSAPRLPDSREFQQLAAGEGCPLCSPRDARTPDRHFIAQLSVSSLYLNGNQAYRGWCQLVFDPRHVAALDELTAAEAGAFSENLLRATRAIRAELCPLHINIASLGNITPHLHWHIIPRYSSDPRWGQPIWTTQNDEMARAVLGEAEMENLARAIGDQL